jgi:hypothetical protein
VGAKILINIFKRCMEKNPRQDKKRAKQEERRQKAQERGQVL